MSDIPSVLAGLVNVPAFATDVRKDPRTVMRWIRNGLPTTRIGREIWIDPVKARRWFEEGMPPRAKPLMRRRA
jgi:hypothetical protein